MNFSFSDDQRQFAASVRDLLGRTCTTDDVAQAWSDGPDPSRWTALADVGLLGTLVADDHGGLGLSETFLCLVLEECGWAGLPEPLVEVAVVAAPLLAASDVPAARSLLAPLVRGEVRVTTALAADPVPAHLVDADHVLVEHLGALHLVAPSAARLTPQPNVDGARPTATVSLDGPDPATMVLPPGHPAIAAAAARGSWATAAMLLGAGRRTIDLATTHALAREQFGRPIGTFQAVKHHLATAVVALEFARPLVHRAAWSLATDAAEASLHAAMAKAAAGEAATAAAKAALQVHGAIGYTWEHPLHLFMKRVWSLDAAWGTTERHWQQIEAATLA